LRNIFLTGSNDCLLVHLAAAYIAAAANDIAIYRMHYRAEQNAHQPPSFAELVHRAAPEQKLDSMRLRLHDMEWIEGRWNIPDTTQADELWYLPFPASEPQDTCQIAIDRIIQSSCALGVRQINIVVKAAGGDLHRSSERTFEAEAFQRCCAIGIGCRVFRYCLAFSNTLMLCDPELDGLLQAVFNVKKEIEERVPDYFDFQPLKYWMSCSGKVNLMDAGKAAKLIVNLALAEQVGNGGYDVIACRDTEFSELCEHIGEAVSLSLIAAKNEDGLNAIDRLIQDSVAAFERDVAKSTALSSGEEITKLNQHTLRVERSYEDQKSFFRKMSAAHTAVYAEWKQRVEGVTDALEAKTVTRSGLDLLYWVIGPASGSPIVILNALGQGTIFWSRLVEALRLNHRLILWDQRGTVLPDEPFGLIDQVADLSAILANEQVTDCHLVGWCTGPKIAVEYYRGHPGLVRSMVFLNSQFKCSTTPKQLTTIYEQRIDPIFRLVQARPELAPTVMQSLTTNLLGSMPKMSEMSEDQELALRVLTAMNVQLKPHVLRPYQNEFTTRNYARQICEFWSHDTLAKCDEVRIPVLLIAAEYDRIAAPQMSQAAAAYFPRSSYVEIKGANHYCIYDRPEVIAKLLRAFIAAA
jgi:pimeloyl-ACP methyl ester carboxylesterase